jgi:hypothetical protein
VVDEVQGHTNDTQANVSEENMHGDRNPENIILTQKSKLMVIVWCEQDNPLKDSHIMVLEIQRISIRFMGKKSSSIYQSTTITQTNLSIYLTLHLLVVFLSIFVITISHNLMVLSIISSICLFCSLPCPCKILE